MPRKTRDYASELAARNERAKSRGFSSYAQLRRALAKVKNTDAQPTPPAPRVLSPKQLRRNAYARDRGFHNDFQRRSTLRGYSKSDLEDECQGWSEIHAKTWMAEYNPPDEPGPERDAYTESYFAAWVAGPGRYGAVRRRGSESLRHWFIDILGNPDLEDKKDYDGRYGLVFAK